MMNRGRGIIRITPKGIFCCMAAALLLVPPGYTQQHDPQERLNLLLITIDTLRPDRLSCYSPDYVRTPHIDRLAESGVRFNRAFAHTPTTLPSHANILLGMTPATHGVHDNAHFIVREEFLTLAEHLRENGYATGAFVGAFPLDSRFGLNQGFDVYDDNCGSGSSQVFSYIERRAAAVIDNALAWLEVRKEPWFLWIHCYDPHQKYNPPEPFSSEYRDDPYSGEVAYVDHTLGELFNYLNEHNHQEKTLIVFTADHGESLGEHGEISHGYFAYNSSLWVPLIIHGPGIHPGVSEETVCHVDIFPTVCDALHVAKPDSLEGISLILAARGNPISQREIYIESLYPHYSRGWAPLIGFIAGHHKFLESPIPEVYDLGNDFLEKRNLASGLELDPYRKRLSVLVGGKIRSSASVPKKKIDRRGLEKLASLGYIGDVRPSRKSVYTEEDDLKTLLPYQVKLSEAMASYHAGHIERAKQILGDIIRVRKDFDQAYACLATIYKEQAQFRQAIQILKEGYSNNPDSYKLISTFAIVLNEAGEHDAAISLLKKGLDIIDYDPDLWNSLGIAYWRKGDLDSALDAYLRALALDENYPIVLNNLGSLYLTRAMKNKSRGDLDLALETFKKAIVCDPSYASAYNGLGSAYAQAGDRQAAIICWEKAVKFSPGLAFPLYNLGLSYLAEGDKDKALGYFVRYKKNHYQRLSTQERSKLDALIAKSRRLPKP